MKTKRRSVIAITALTLVSLLLVSFTLAYLTDKRSTLNLLGIGASGPNPGDDKTVQIKLTEPEFEKVATEKAAMAKGEADEFSKLGLYNIVPGQEVNKDPTVTNIGAEDVYIRVKVVSAGANGATINLEENKYVKMLGFTVDTDNWVKVGDYWYYRVSTNPADAKTGTKLAKNAAVKFFKNIGTAPKNYTMRIPTTIDNEDLTSNNLFGVVNMEIIAEAIQSREFTPDLTKAVPWAYSEADPDKGIAIGDAVEAKVAAR